MNSTIDVTYVGAPAGSVSFTPVLVASETVAVINDVTGDVVMMPLQDAYTQFGQDGVIVINPNAAQPVAGDSIVKVTPSGPIVPSTKLPGTSIVPANPAPGPLVQIEPSTAPLASELGGLLNKEGGRVAKILGKLGRAGKLIGPAAVVASLLLQGIAALQGLFGSPSNDKDKAGKYNGGDHEGVPGGGAIVPTQPGTGQLAGAGVSQASVDALESMDFVGLMIAMDCGQLADLSGCLCDANLRRAVTLLNSRFDPASQQALIRKLCGCQVQPRQLPVTPAQPTNYVPAVYVNPSTPTPQPSQPTCYTQTAPPSGTFK